MDGKDFFTMTNAISAGESITLDNMELFKEEPIDVGLGSFGGNYEFEDSTLSSVDIDLSLDDILLEPTPVTPAKIKVRKNYPIVIETIDKNIYNSIENLEVSVLEYSYLKFMIDQHFEIINKTDVIVDTWNHAFSNRIRSKRVEVLDEYFQLRYGVYFENKDLIKAFMAVPERVVEKYVIPYRQLIARDISNITTLLKSNADLIDVYKKYATTEIISHYLMALIQSNRVQERLLEKYSLTNDRLLYYLLLEQNSRFDEEMYDKAIKENMNLKIFTDNLINTVEDYKDLQFRKDFLQIQNVCREYENVHGSSPSALLEKYKSYDGLFYIIKGFLNGVLSEVFIEKNLRSMDGKYSQYVAHNYALGTIPAETYNHLKGDYVKSYVFSFYSKLLGAPVDWILSMLGVEGFVAYVNKLFELWQESKIEKFDMYQFLFMCYSNSYNYGYPEIMECFSRGIYRFTSTIVSIKLGNRLESVPEVIDRHVICKLGNKAVIRGSLDDIMLDNPSIMKYVSKAEKIDLIEDNLGLVFYVPIDGKRDYLKDTNMEPDCVTSLFNWALNCELNGFVPAYGLDSIESVYRYNLLIFIKQLKQLRYDISEKFLDMLTCDRNSYLLYDRVLYTVSDSTELNVSIAKSDYGKVLLASYKLSYVNKNRSIVLFNTLVRFITSIFPNKLIVNRDNLVNANPDRNVFYCKNLGPIVELDFKRLCERMDSIIRMAGESKNVKLWVERGYLYLEVVS